MRIFARKHSNLESDPDYLTAVRLAQKYQWIIPHMASSWQYNNKHAMVPYTCVQYSASVISQMVPVWLFIMLSNY